MSLPTSQLLIPAPPDFANQSRDFSTTGFGPGVFQVGDAITRIGNEAIIRGDGLNPDGTWRTTLVNTNDKDSAKGCLWEGNNALVEDICFVSQCLHGEQSQVIGWQNNYFSSEPDNPNAADQSKCGTLLTLNRFFGLGRTFTLYSWSARGRTPLPNRVKAHASRFEAGQFPILAGSGSGADAQYFDLYDCISIADFDRLTGAGGDQGMNACGVGAQGGRVRMYGGTIRVKGGVNAERAVGIWATAFPATPPKPIKPDWKYAFPVMQFADVDCKVDGNGCKGPVADVIGDLTDPKTPPIKILRGTGSGPKGEWLIRGNVEVIDAPFIRFAA